MASGIEWSVAGKSDRGCVRRNNEDSLAIDRELGLLAVADGMGGHNSGEVASRIATRTLLKLGRSTSGQAGGPSRRLEGLVRAANAAILEKSRTSPRNRGMGTTLVAALVEDAGAAIAHVGDSRLYLFRGGALQALTEDHSLIAEQVKSGLITPEEAERSDMRNILLRALGTEADVRVDVRSQALIPGDVLLLCTDGLNRMVSDGGIARALQESADPRACCERLVREAREAGGRDNVTVVVARIIGRGSGEGRARR